MADLSKFNVNGQEYNLKDAAARGRLDTVEAELISLEEEKQDVIDPSNMLPAEYVSLDPEEGTKLTSTEVNSAIYELEAAIESGGTGSIVTVEKQTTAETGYFATYVIKQDGEAVTGPKINIPKDFLVKSAELKTVTTKDQPYEGAEIGDKYIDFVINVKEGSATDEHIYLPVNDLVDEYFADGTTILLDDATNTFSVGEIDMDQVDGLEGALALKADEADLQAEITRATAEEAKKLEADDMGALAFKDSGSVSVASKTISGVAATGNLSGSAAITLTSSAADAALTKGDFTPAGTISAAEEGGSFSALKTATFGADNNGVQISGTNADSEVTIDSTPATVLGAVKTAAVAPSFTDNKIGTFVAPQLTITPSDAFAKAGVTADVQSETLVLTNAATATASVCTGWSAGSWTQGTFNAGSAAEFENASVIGSISGGTAAAQVFTGNKYSVATTQDTALKNVVFEGTTASNVLVTGVSYDKADASQSGNVSITNASLAVGDIVVPAQTVDVDFE